MQQVESMICKVLEMISDMFKPIYFIYDGAFGNNSAVQMVTRCGLHIISKLRHDSALYLKWDGGCLGKGRPKKYGKKIDYNDLPDKHRISKN